MKQDRLKIIHDKYAPYWAIALVVLGGTGVATIWIDLGLSGKGMFWI